MTYEEDYMTRDAELLQASFRKPGVAVTPEQMLVRKQTYEQVTEQPKTFAMTSWENEQAGAIDAGGSGPSCRTTRCLAGWAQYLVRGVVIQHIGFEDDVNYDAIRVMGLSEEEYYRYGRGGLFFTGDQEAVRWLAELAQIPVTA